MELPETKIQEKHRKGKPRNWHKITCQKTHENTSQEHNHTYKHRKDTTRLEKDNKLH